MYSRLALRSKERGLGRHWDSISPGSEPFSADFPEKPDSPHRRKMTAGSEVGHVCSVGAPGASLWTGTPRFSQGLFPLSLSLRRLGALASLFDPTPSQALLCFFLF